VNRNSQSFILKAGSMRRATPMALLASVALAGCSTTLAAPPIAYDDVAVPAVLEKEPKKPIKVVAIPKVLPMPGQLKPVSDKKGSEEKPEPAEPTERVNKANAAARVEPVKDGFINAVQVYPYSSGALYQVYTAPGQITDVALQDGEQLVGSGPVAAGDTVRWIIGDTESGAGASKKIHILIKPTRPDLITNLVINTDRRTYLLELRSKPSTYMASVSWLYAQDELIALRQENAMREAVLPIDAGVDVSKLQFRYEITGDTPPWRPLSAFDDGSKVYIEMPRGLSQGEAPPLFVIGSEGEGQLVNYRVRKNYYIVDRLFAAAELRLGGRNQQTVRITRNDGGWFW
jgi:P-type conjugative transfer protein TrbG